MVRRFISVFCVVWILLPAVASAAPIEEDFSVFAASSSHTEDHADVFRLYWAFFDREPDTSGARYWATQYDQCASLLDITWSFANSTEFATQYGGLTAGGFVDVVYRNALDRAPDSDGRSYWSKLLTTGELQPAEVVLYFSLSDEFRSRQPLPSDGRASRGCTPPLSFQPGTYIVGPEVPLGVYRVERYWATLDTAQDIIDNDLAWDGPTLAVVSHGAAYIQFSGPAKSLAAQPTVDPIAMGYQDGTYLVGTDIPPGTYRISNSDRSAYGARLDANLDIIDNDLNPNSVILTVSPTDYAFTFSGQIEKLN